MNRFPVNAGAAELNLSWMLMKNTSESLTCSCRIQISSSVPTVVSTGGICMSIKLGNRRWEQAACAQAQLVRAAWLRNCAYLICTGNILRSKVSPKSVRLYCRSVVAVMLSDVIALIKVVRENLSPPFFYPQPLHLFVKRCSPSPQTCPHMCSRKT